jgi:radical SAM superfamily enzyme YgiQ (UPF0313 family)
LVRTIANKDDLAKIAGIVYREGATIRKNPLRPLTHNLDEIPFPARDLTQIIIEQGGLPVISSGRGCYNGCSYCTISSFYGAPPGNPFRLRSAENVRQELSVLKSRFPDLKDIWFVDDNFIQKGEKGIQRAKDICDTLKALNLKFDIYLRADDVNEKIAQTLKDSGVRSVFVGLEAGTDKTLRDVFKKRTTVEQNKRAVRLCQDFEINIEPGFIMFHPWSTMDEIGENIKFLREIDSFTPFGVASFLTTYRFTPIGQEMLSGKRPYKPSKYVSDDPLQDDVPYEIQDYKAELLLDITLKAFREFNGLPRALRRLKAEARKQENKRFLEMHANQTSAFGEASLNSFERLYCFLRKTDLNGIKEFFETLVTGIRDYTSKSVGTINQLVALDAQSA